MTDSSSVSSLHLVDEHEPSERRDDGGWGEYFTKGDLLGAGGYAQVFLARRIGSSDEVALKVLEAASARERFRREIDEQRRARHPNVMPVLEFGADWYAMPRAVGTLTDLAPEMSDDERLKMLRDVARGLAHAHEHRLVHRDVSPNNIMLLRDSGLDTWVIGDFGLVRRPPGQTSGAATGGPVGTGGFVAPEVFIMGAHRVDHRADIYSLGRVVAYAVTGHWPSSEEQIPNVPAEWTPLVELLTCRAIDERLQSLGQIEDGLREVEKRLRAGRRRLWGTASHGVEYAQASLAPTEVAALAAILDHGFEEFTRHRLLDEAHGRTRRELVLGLVGLERRSFLKEVPGEHGSEWRLTDVALDWSIRNGSKLLGEAQGDESRSEEPGGGDDAPF